MKLKTIILTTAFIASSLFAAPVKADTYLGGGYTVTIDGFAGSTSYTGCDPKGRCLNIPQASHYTQGAYIWESGGYTYNMSPVRNNSGQYRLKIFNPSGKLILNQVMAPTNRNVAKQTPILCDVVRIQKGQLALRFAPNGKSKAGLNNGNRVVTSIGTKNAEFGNVPLCIYIQK